MTQETKSPSRRTSLPSQYMTLDILHNVLSQADSPKGLGDYLNEQIRELTGARMVALVTCLHHQEIKIHRVVSLIPQRHKGEVSEDDLLELAKLTHGSNEYLVVFGKDSGSPIGKLMGHIGLGTSMIVPLWIGNSQTGSLLLFGLPEESRFKAVAEVLEPLTPVVAALLRHSILYQEMEGNVESRTEDLIESQRHFAEIVESTPAGYCLINRDGCYQYVNPAWLNLHGYSSANEIIGKHYRISQDPNAYGEADDIVSRILNGETVSRSDFPRRCKDGTIMQETFTASPVRSKSEIIGLEAFIIDTTAYRQAEANYRMLFNTMLDGFALHEIICDEEGKPVDYRFLDINPSFVAMTGMTREAAIGHTILELFPGIEAKWIEIYGNVALTGQADRFESWSREIGKHFEILAFAPRIGQFACLVHDITDRKQVEERQKLSTRVLELLNRPSTQSDTIRDILIALKEAMGYEAVAVRLKDGSDFPYYVTNGFPEEFVEAERFLCDSNALNHNLKESQGNAFLECMCGNVLCSRTNPSLPFFTEKGSFWSNNTTELLATTTEERRLARTRNRCNGEGYESVALIPLRSDSGIIGLLQVNDKRKGVFTPETISFLEGLGESVGIALGRKKSEESVQQLVAAFDQADDSMVIADPEGRIIYVNHAFEQMTGYSKAELIGQNPRILKSGEHDEAFYNNLWTTIKSGETWNGRFRNLRKDGSVYDEEATISPIRDASNALIGFLALKRDITADLMIEAQKRQSQKMEAIGTLAGGIAHDFNNILQAVLGYAEMSLEDAPEGSTIATYLQEIKLAGKRAADLVYQILTFSRQTDQVQRPILLQPILKEIRKLLRGSIPSTINIQQEIQSKCPPVMADPIQIHQVVMNLCTNAYHAMQEKGGLLKIDYHEVYLESKMTDFDFEIEPGSYCCLEISDTGEGMSQETLERIFEPFFTTKAIGEGTGMGLATVHGIVKNHKGAVAVQSELGRGTTFSIYFPVCLSKPLMQTDERITRPKFFGSGNILFIDDEAAIVELGKVALERLGYNVTPCSSGIEALSLFRTSPMHFDVIVTDMTMPYLTGLELAGMMLAIRSDIPIILCSGFAEISNEQKVRAVGIREFVAKPVVFGDLAEKISGLLKS